MHRGSVLGVILGLANGSALEGLFDQLQDKAALDDEIAVLVG
ncbi:MAG: hypothetical protein ACE37N_06595 [Pseudohongiellaceae bacterium]